MPGFGLGNASSIRTGAMMFLTAMALIGAVPAIAGSSADRASLAVDDLNRMPATRIHRFGDTFKVKVTLQQLEVFRIPKAFVHNASQPQFEEMRQVASELASPCGVKDGYITIWGKFEAKIECSDAAKPQGLEIAGDGK